MLRPFQTPTHSKRTYRELKLLMYLNHPDAQVCTNHSFVIFQPSSVFFMLKVVQLLNVFTPEKNLNDFQTLYVEKILFFDEHVYFYLVIQIFCIQFC